jgi:putative hydrolase of the HAD superfamily
MKYRNYIFDLYGTLIDIHTDEEMPQLWEFMSGYLEENFGTHISPGNLRREYLRICALEEEKLAGENGSMYPEIKIEWVWKKLIGKQTCTEDEMRRLCVSFREKSRDRLEVYEGVLEVFSAIRNNGGRIFLLSNAQRLFTEKELEDTGLALWFDDIFISSDHGIKKPDGLFLQRLLDKHGLIKKECVMIGNEPAADGGVADAVGIDSIIVSDFELPDDVL